MSSGRTPAAFRLRNAVKEKPVIALTVPRINEGSRSGTSMLTHSTESGWMPTARAKTGNRRRGAAPPGAPRLFPTRSCGARMVSPPPHGVRVDPHRAGKDGKQAAGRVAHRRPQLLPDEILRRSDVLPPQRQDGEGRRVEEDGDGDQFLARVARVELDHGIDVRVP